MNNNPKPLKLLALVKCMPDRLKATLLHMERTRGQDYMTPVVMMLDEYNVTLDQMIDFNLDYGGWWGLPGPISKFTTESIWEDPQYDF